VQFEIVPRGAATSGEVSKEVLQTVASWVAEWYLRRKTTSIQIPVDGGTVQPRENHEITVARSLSSDGHVSRSTVTWSYPDDNDGNLLWHSKCELSEFSGLLEFSLQLLLDSTQFYIAPVEFNLGRPRVIATLLRQFECIHGDTRLSLEPSGLTAQGVPDFLHKRLYSNRRRLPIVLVSRTTVSDKWLVDPGELADRLAGIAEVCVLDDKWAAYALSNEIGKLYSCYNGAVRIYWPDFDPSKASYSPIYLPARIHVLGAKLAGTLFRQLSAISTFRYVPGPVATDATEYLHEQQRKEMEEIRRAAQERGDYAELLDLADRETAALKKQVADARQENESLRASLQLSQENLQSVWRAQEDRRVAAPVELAPEEEEFEPASIEEAVRAAEDQFKETLEFRESAFESARECPFKQPKKVYQALLAMHEVCQAWRQSRKTRTPMGSPDQSFANKGFEYKPRESMTSKGKWGAEYEMWYKGHRVSVEQHLALGKGGPDTCLRIHFYSDESTGKYVIAHVGRHKTNTKS
jgi:hypothetical protein